MEGPLVETLAQHATPGPRSAVGRVARFRRPSRGACSHMAVSEFLAAAGWLEVQGLVKTETQPGALFADL